MNVYEKDTNEKACLCTYAGVQRVYALGVGAYPIAIVDTASRTVVVHFATIHFPFAHESRLSVPDELTRLLFLYFSTIRLYFCFILRFDFVVDAFFIFFKRKRSPSGFFRAFRVSRTATPRRTAARII